MDLHGGNVYRYEKEGKKDLLDYSSNINPLGVPENFVKFAREHFHLFTKYPDPDYVDLRETIAKHNGIKTENVVVGNGATEILFLYMRALKPKKVLLLAPCFAEYKRALETVGAKMEYFPLEEKKEENSFTLNVEQLLEQLEKEEYDLLVLCNPNNPTGSFLSLEKLEQLRDCIEKKKLHLFIDEAFIEFVGNWQKKTAMLLQSNFIFVMRALTKFFAIPGLRLGYGLSHDQEILKKMQEEKEPWTVNSFANLAGCMMLEDQEYIDKTEKWIQEEKEFMYQEFTSFSTLKAYKTETNFILVQLFTISSRKLQEKMLEQGILIRDASNFPFLNDCFVRLAIKDRKSNLRVLKTLSEILEERSS